MAAAGLVAVAVPAARAGRRGGGRPAARARQRLTPEASSSPTPRPPSRRRRQSTRRWSSTSSVAAVRLRRRAGPAISRRTRACSTHRCGAAGASTDYALLEFPPVLDHATPVHDRRRRLGEGARQANRPQAVAKQVGTLAAASPALGASRAAVRAGAVDRRSGRTPATAASSRCRMKTGRVAVVSAIPAGIGVLAARVGDTVYFGDQSGHGVLPARPGRTRQLDLPRERRGQGRPGAGRTGSCTSATTPGARTRPTRATGHQVWAVSTNGAQFGFGSGNFYSTPAVAFGRVYMGNTDGRVYSFAAQHRAARVGHGHRRLRLRLARGGERPGSARPCTSAPTTGTSTRSTRASGAIRWTPLRRRQDLGLGDDHRRRSSTTRIWARRPPTGLDVRTGRAGVLLPGRAVQPGGLPTRTRST